eukprot:m.197990 g.197990  ORF g.197990 m.197990 type:complete len:746 (+) comp10088_c0_seq51:4962-7199(+)
MLLMSDRYREAVDKGLLFYSQTGEMFGIPAWRADIRGLMIARNTLAAQLSSKDLPAVLEDQVTCSRCPMLDVCALYHRVETLDAPPAPPPSFLIEEKTRHLTEAHVRYFAHWDRMMDLEASLAGSRKDIWTQTAAQREQLGLAFSMVRVARRKASSADGLSISYELQRHPDYDRPYRSFLDSKLSPGDLVAISSEDGRFLAFASGLLVDVTADSVVIALEAPLRLAERDYGTAARTIAEASQHQENFPMIPLRIDRDSGSSEPRKIRGSLATLFVQKIESEELVESSELERRRIRLIADLEPPIFSSPLSLPVHIRAMISSLHLNEDQQAAVERVLVCQDYALILGMPGTGKTTTIALLVSILHRAGLTVLLTAFTHSAVDNILLKLKEDPTVPFTRLGKLDRIHRDIRAHALANEVEDLDAVASIGPLYRSKPVVATTCLGINFSLFHQRLFDVCIVDEASQTTQAICLGPLRFARRFVLVGDHYQLPPLVQSVEARTMGMEISLFKRLCDAHPEAVVALEFQYRMNADVMRLCNALIYGYRMRCANAFVSEARLAMPYEDVVRETYSLPHQRWVHTAVSPSNSVLFFDTDEVPGKEVRIGETISNPVESALVHILAEALALGGANVDDIGIVTPYRAQLKYIHSLVGEHVECNTIDKYQGRDKACILVSLVRSNSKGIVGDLLTDWRRLNVAMTRAKCKLVFFGSASTMQTNAVLRGVISLARECGWLHRLPANAHMGGAELS